MSRTAETLENEPENLVKIDSRDDLGLPGGSLSDMTCENFISKVQDVLSVTHDDSVLPETLESVMCGKKALSREPGSFRENPGTDVESRKDAIAISASSHGDCLPAGHETDTTSGSSVMSSLEAGVAQMNIKNGKHLLMSLSKEEDLCCDELRQRPETIGQLETKSLASPSLDQGNESGFVDMCNLSACDSKRNLSSEQQLIDLLESKSLESKLTFSQNHSDEEEEEEENEEDSLDMAAGLRERPETLQLTEPMVSVQGEKNSDFHVDEARKGNLDMLLSHPGPQHAFPPAAYSCPCKHMERWTRAFENDGFELEKPKGYSPDLHKSQTNNPAMEGEPLAVPSEPFKLKPDLLKESWKESAEGKKGFPPYPLEGSELKAEDMDFEGKDDYDRDGNCHSQGMVVVILGAS